MKSLKTLIKWEHNLAIITLSLAIITVDRIVKFYIEEYLTVGEMVPVINNVFSITRVQNVGAAFGMFQGMTFLFILAAVMVFGLFIYFYQTVLEDNRLIIAAGMIIGGTVGNLMDRIYFGYVIDYLDIAFWPTFNLSDSFLVIGMLLLLTYIGFSGKKEISSDSKYSHY